ncbi:MAG: RagB/SusD family nutrient uptake outer membrane protein [Bacteroidales bacterium]|nr:RagB/SusD family nutrient uptake outer membrane protein [Bacteroidales bacterium]
MKNLRYYLQVIDPHRRGASNKPHFSGRGLRIYSMVLIMVLAGYSCEEFFDPTQELVRYENDMFADWDEYRSAEMGLYALQQKLVDQLVVLGELRGDLLEVTDFASQDLIEVNNFSIRKDNPYASPVNFYKLIIAANKLIHHLSTVHPEVLDKNAPITNFDRLYGEAMCMRTWAYFNAVRIYGEVPYIHESLYTVEEIEAYINSSSEYVVSEYINFAPDGYYNDTIRDTTIVIEKRFMNEKNVILTFTDQLENNIKAVGINHSLNNGDDTWQVTVWNDYARHALLGQMYMFDQNYSMAVEHFDHIMYNNTSETSNILFGLDNKFAKAKWRNIFTSLDPCEHIYMIWFGKSYKQTNGLQKMMGVTPNDYMVKPTAASIQNWESIWNNPVYYKDFSNPLKSRVIEPGIPGDFYRGYGVSYQYFRDGIELTSDDVQDMLLKKMDGNIVEVQLLMERVDAVATKYEINKDPFAQDANYTVFRAAGIHLYAAEIYAVWKHIYGGLTTTPRIRMNTSLNILNDGSYNSNTSQLGVRGRVGFADGDEAVNIDNIVYIHDPVSNQITGYIDFTNQPDLQMRYMLDKILQERAMEMAFEGERFYDLIRIAKRLDDPSYLAEKVAAKFKDPVMRENIYNKLLNEENWYVNYF